ncbi:phosphoadenosine phosphosulfate reductase domain-containing protein [Paenibacillus senegalensis]|uniref:phosphoadenosine phosphosulfate reductase domain-containing protein n=1 Tax=Paenibacillus senegalensis TaxID=1465766 RepID=UPI0002884FB5|nr:phosphoadenosine phosphosulfate reductase family protein [Paenibacillus senegalensis]
MGQTVNVMTVSGGKDSAAMWIYAVKELGVEVYPVFCDTGNEHPMTYEYIDYLESVLGPIHRVKADFSKQISHKREVVQTKWRNDRVSEEIIQQALEMLHPTGNPFLDMCLWKGRFPSTKARFCTQELKIIPTLEQVYIPLLEDGKEVVSWQGVRAQESPHRARLTEWEDTPEGYRIYRPLLKWSVEDVFEMHERHSIKPNPLYKMGMGRVGCMPCINCGKQELFEIARRFPEEVARIAEWEELVKKASKRQGATFFPTANGQGEGVHEVVEWSKTTYGGKQYDLVKAIEFEDVPVCSSQYGLCE